MAAAVRYFARWHPEFMTKERLRKETNGSDANRGVDRRTQKTWDERFHDVKPRRNGT